MAYDDHSKASIETGLKCLDKTLTQQHFLEECDINTIAERFGLTGELPHVQQLPTYDDFEGIFDYQTAMNAIVAARETFMLYPAKLRARFNNDPQEFVKFCSDHENADEIIRLGLGTKPKLPPTDEDGVVLEPSSKAPDPKKPAPKPAGKQPDPKKDGTPAE